MVVEKVREVEVVRKVEEEEVEDVKVEEAEDDEQSFSEREQLVLELELVRGDGREVDLIWQTQGGTRATQPQSQILRSRRPLCYLDSGKMCPKKFDVF